MGDRTVPWGEPVEVDLSVDVALWKRKNCVRSVKKLIIQRMSRGQTCIERSLSAKRWGWMVLKAEGKSIKSIRTKESDFSRWEYALCSKVIVASLCFCWLCMQIEEDPDMRKWRKEAVSEWFFQNISLLLGWELLACNHLKIWGEYFSEQDKLLIFSRD